MQAVENMTAMSQQSSAGTEELLATTEQYMTSNSKAQQLAAIADTLRIAHWLNFNIKKRESCWQGLVFIRPYEQLSCLFKKLRNKLISFLPVIDPHHIVRNSKTVIRCVK